MDGQKTQPREVITAAQWDAALEVIRKSFVGAASAGKEPWVLSTNYALMSRREYEALMARAERGEILYDLLREVMKVVQGEQDV